MGSLHHPHKTSMPALGNEGWTYFSSFHLGSSTLVKREGQSGTCQRGGQNRIQTQKWPRRNQKAKLRPEAALTFISSMGIIKVSFPT